MTSALLLAAILTATPGLHCLSDGAPCAVDADCAGPGVCELGGAACETNADCQDRQFIRCARCQGAATPTPIRDDFPRCPIPGDYLHSGPAHCANEPEMACTADSQCSSPGRCVGSSTVCRNNTECPASLCAYCLCDPTPTPSPTPSPHFDDAGGCQIAPSALVQEGTGRPHALPPLPATWTVIDADVSERSASMPTCSVTGSGAAMPEGPPPGALLRVPLAIDVPPGWSHHYAAQADLLSGINALLAAVSSRTMLPENGSFRVEADYILIWPDCAGCVQPPLGYRTDWEAWWSRYNRAVHRAGVLRIDIDGYRDDRTGSEYADPGTLCTVRSDAAYAKVSGPFLSVGGDASSLTCSTVAGEAFRQAVYLTMHELGHMLGHAPHTACDGLDGCCIANECPACAGVPFTCPDPHDDHGSALSRCADCNNGWCGTDSPRLRYAPETLTRYMWPHLLAAPCVTEAGPPCDGADADGDGVPDNCDSCPLTPNSWQQASACGGSGAAPAACPPPQLGAAQTAWLWLGVPVVGLMALRRWR